MIEGKKDDGGTQVFFLDSINLALYERAFLLNFINVVWEDTIQYVQRGPNKNYKQNTLLYIYKNPKC